jgi:carbamate kinase
VARQTIDIWDFLKVTPRHLAAILLTLLDKKSHRSTWSYSQSLSRCHTHGNGPQVGAQLLRSEPASDQVPAQTLDVCGVASQGEIGYLLSQSLQSELFAAGLKAPVVRVVTQTVVRRDDPAML